VSAGELNMAEKKFIVSRVPATEVDQVIKEYEIDSPVKITKIANGDGTFNLEVVFSDAGESRS
jgi:hypothetical protein